MIFTGPPCTSCVYDSFRSTLFHSESVVNEFFLWSASNQSRKQAAIPTKEPRISPPLYDRFHLYAFSSCLVSFRDGLMSPGHEDAAGISRFPRIRWETTSPVTRRVFFRFFRVFKCLFALSFVFTNDRTTNFLQ